MQAEDFIRTLNSAKILPIYLFVGDSAFLMDEAWKKLIAKAFPGGVKKFNGERAQAKEMPAGDVIERLATVPMFGPRKLLMVENVESWGKEDRAAMEAFLPRIPPSACLVLTASGRKSIEALAKAVEAKGAVVQFRAPQEKEAPRWLIERARQRGKVLAHRAAFLLVELVGDDFSTLSSELDKICTFTGDRETIEPEDIQEAASSQRSFSMFDLLDQVKARQAGKAVKSLRSLVLSGEAPLKILSTLAWQIRSLWQVKEGLGQGLSESQLAGRLKLHPFAVKKACGQAGRFSDVELHRILDAIRQTDVAMKSTGTSPEVLLEELLLDLCLDKKKPSEKLRGL